MATFFENTFLGLFIKAIILGRTPRPSTGNRFVPLALDYPPGMRMVEEKKP
jgi:hypothetical protein